MAIQSGHTYDVFLSFRGEDTRKNFVDHLLRELDLRGIKTFRDHSDGDLPRGKAISPELMRAIEESRYVLVIFSENYASSTWCLEEIAKIVECKDISAGLVIPIFYKVNPSDVRKIRGSFQRDFAKHEENYKDDMEKLARWKAALDTTANLSGEAFSDGYESQFIQKFVKEIENRLGARFSYVADDLVAINSRVAKVVEQLYLGESDVRSIGICGMGGIGKTTTARAVYENIRDQFERSWFIANVREVSDKNGLLHIQCQLLHNILKDNNLSVEDVHQGANIIKERLQYKKVILVLDDVDKQEQLERLAGRLDWFGHGSRIIITTRDEHLLQQHRVNYTYKIEGLTNEEALELFSLKAFKSHHPPNEFNLLSEHIVIYANGLPLALDVLGSFLFNRNLEAWQSALARLEKCPNMDIFNQLKISYDGLTDEEKEIFLDIACFFGGIEESYVVELLKSCGLYPEIGIQVLLERSLITVEENRLQMHDLLQEMGQEIVRQESPDEPGKRSRIWLFEDIYHILTNNSGSAYIKGIVLRSHERSRTRLIEHGRKFTGLEISLLEKVRGNDIRKDLLMAANLLLVANLREESFAKMTNLRFLCVNYIYHPFVLENRSNELRHLAPNSCGLKSFTPSFHSWNLVKLNMHSSSMRKLWMGNEVFDKLKVIDLSNSNLFVETPNFKNVPNLERLICRNCMGLHKVDPSIGVLQKLILLDLSWCNNLQSLPDSVGNLSSLNVLNLYSCSCLGELPQSIGLLKCLEELDISWTAITHLPLGLAALEKLKILRLHGCDGRRTNFWKRSMLSVRYVINLRGSRWPSFSALSNLTELDLSCCNLQEGEIPIDIGCLSSLRSLFLSRNNFTTIPTSICDIPGLEILIMNYCKNVEALPRLPESIFLVNAEDCFQLKRISNPFIVCTASLLGIIGRCFINYYRFFPENLGLTLQQKYYLSSLRYTICHSITETYQDFHFMVSPLEYGIPKWFSFQTNGSFLHMGMPPRWFNRCWSGFVIYASLKQQNGYSLQDFPRYLILYCDLFVDGGYCWRDRFYPGIKIANSGYLWLGFTSYRKFLHFEDWKAITSSSHIDVRLSTNDERFEVEKCGVHPVYEQNPADFDALLVRWASSSPQDWDCICHELKYSIPVKEDVMTKLECRTVEDLFRALRPVFQGDAVDRLMGMFLDGKFCRF